MKKKATTQPATISPDELSPRSVEIAEYHINEILRSLSIMKSNLSSISPEEQKAALEWVCCRVTAKVINDGI